MITLIDYGGGNVRSLTNALDRLGAVYQVTSDPVLVAQASCVIFPGQGAAGQGMERLRGQGLVEGLKNFTMPFFGICIGMQLLFDSTAEDNVEGLGMVSGRLERFSSPTLKIPQMGWNRVAFAGDSPLFKGIPNESFFYFIHSYAAPLAGEWTLGVSFYGQPFTSVLEKENFFGVQFHPEKSGEVGLQLLRNFLEL